MRSSPFFAGSVMAICVLAASGQTPVSKLPYQLDFDRIKDVSQSDRSPDGKDGIYIKVRFGITLDGNKVENLSDDYKIVIEEDGHRIKVFDVPRPVASEDLTVMLALDTSGSMKEHGRMEQARVAAGVFLRKLPRGADCGLILFDHEVRDSLIPIYDRTPLLTKIQSVQPRGGTAYLDAASVGIKMLQSAQRGRERALVIVTDGIDLNSKKLIEQIIQEATQERVRVYTIGIGEPGKLDQVNTVLALDHSGSMKPPADDQDTISKIEALHLAGERFVDSMSSVGRASILPFSTYVGTPEPFLDKSRGLEIKANIKALRPVGETALLDATYDAVCLLDADGAKGKRAVIAMTDGKDNSSRRGVEEVIARAKEARIQVHMLGFGQPIDLDDRTMKMMAEQTGGKFYHAKNKASLIEIFENLSIQLHDDGIDEIALKRIARETGGKYYPAKNVKDLQLIFEQVTQNIQRESHEIVFASLSQRADGKQRNVTLKLIRVDAGGTENVVEELTGSYLRRGLVVAEMSHIVYVILLVLLGGLIALPTLLRKSGV